METLTCGVVEVGEHEALARHAYDVLCAQATLGINVFWQPQLAGPMLCDLVVLTVESEALALAMMTIAQLRSAMPACNIVAVCADLGSEQIAALLGVGVFDFVSSPYPDTELCTRVQRAAGFLLAHPSLDESAVINVARAHQLIGSSASFVKQLSALPIVANCDASVLILGETGTGKEVFARAVHYLSPRASRPLVAVNCGAIPTELMESELFGCTRGAYTSAHAARSGLVREAEGGTLLLDEIDSLPLGAQTKLLRFLQEKEYRPVGSCTTCRADVRVIAASNHQIATMVERGVFRSDLYFRLNVLNLTLPALRERRDDIPELARHFIENDCHQRHRAMPSLTVRALRKLASYDWPGNVRELHNVIERAVLFCQGAFIGADDLQLPCDRPDDDNVESFRVAKARMVEAFEKTYIERLLILNAGNITHAALDAKKNRRAFFALMRKHDIAPERFRGRSEILP
ncbi:sigma-54-dependent Fis family transcriptional regulator [Dyella halodurans]|uniref:Sigma-54 interaction domain-containing protein n=1 Tax=Dyella halodurans TaxID=1920171 RepID=A0ABV9C2I3_9GAMM|nr:sigma-54 dependent transcriptional regulator [Dyella halodurans]